MGITSSLDNLKSLNSADEMDEFIKDAKNYFDKHLGDANRRYQVKEKIYFSLSCNFFKSKKLPEVTHVCFDVSFQMLGSELKRNPELKREDFAKVCAKIADNLLDPQEANEFIQNKAFELYKFLLEQQEEPKVEESKAEESAEASAQRQDPNPITTNERQNPIPNTNERQNPYLPNSKNNSGRNEPSDPMIRAVKETIGTKFNEQTRVLERNNQEQTRILDEKLERNSQELARTTNEIQNHLRELEGRIDREITRIRNDFENKSIELSQAQLDEIVQRVTQEACERMRKEYGYSERDIEAFRGPVDVHIRHSAAYNLSA